MDTDPRTPFWQVLEQFGQSPALITSERQLSFAQLAAHADALAIGLPAQAGREGRLLISVVMAPDIDVIALYLGALRAGHVVLLSDESILAADNPIAKRFPFDLRISVGVDGLQMLPHPRAPLQAIELHSDLALLLSTSGSTGEPKLVRLSAEAVQSNAAAIVSYLGITADSRAITTLPLFYSYGMSVLHSQMAAGGALILTEASVTEAAFWELGRAKGATSLALVPHQVQLIARSAMSDFPLPDLRYVTQAGGRLPPDQVRRMATKGQAAGWDFFVMYGQTEAGPRISYVPPAQLLEATDTIGRAIPGGTLQIRTEAGELITGPGQSGELVYTGPNVMMGYAEQPAELAGGHETPELATGDLAEWTEAGLVRIVGRLKRFVKLYGMRVSLDQVEAHLSSHSIAAYAVGNDDKLVLFIAPEVETDTARRLVAELIDVPVGDILAHPLTQPPLLASGKIDYIGLDRMAAEAIAEEKAAEGGSKRDLREIMAQATRSRSVSDSDSFTDLGGDSLGFLQVTMAIEQRLGYVPEAWEKMPVGQLMRLVPSTTPRAELGMDVVVRILAISLIVTNHALRGGFNGGTWVLLMTLGLSFFRFQLPAMASQSPGRILFKMYYPVLPLYFLMLASFITIGKEVPKALLTLTANLGPNASAFYFNVNWFISLYAQLVLLLVIVFSIPVMRRLIEDRPFVTTAVIFALSLLGSLGWQGWLYGWFDGVDHNLDSIFRVGSPLTCLPMVALGAMIAYTDGGVRRLWVLAAVVINTIVFPTLSVAHIIALLVGGGLLASGWVLRTPLWLGRIARHMASAALFVYLMHPLVIRALRNAADLDEVLGAVPFVMLVLSVSFLVSWVALSIFRLVETRLMSILWPQNTRTSSDGP